MLPSQMLPMMMLLSASGLADPKAESRFLFPRCVALSVNRYW